jgi:two-component system, OmpR family, copper resistance phosphate regulon response regulator CusR
VIPTEAAMNGSRAFHPAAPRQRVLIVDDEERIRLVLARILRARGIAADAVADGADAVARTVSGSYDLVILDLLMPGQDGFSALREIMNKRPDQAVLVLSCLSDPESKMASLGLGADDYVPKPFHVGELVARVQARLRAAARPGPPVLSFGGLTLDVLHRQADTGAGPVPLTSREFQLLWELMHRPGAVVSKDDLLARVWGGATDSVSNVVDVYVRRLRSRLGPDVITTVRGEGYCVGPG